MPKEQTIYLVYVMGSLRGIFAQRADADRRAAFLDGYVVPRKMVL